jgi:hypothetical protein
MRNFASALFVEIGNVRKEIADDRQFAHWTLYTLKIPLEAITRVAGVLQEVDAVKAKEELADARAAEKAEKRRQREEREAPKLKEVTRERDQLQAQVKRLQAELHLARHSKPEPSGSTPLPKTAQEKVEAAIRAHTKKLDQEYSERVRQGVLQRLEEVGWPQIRDEARNWMDMLRRRKGFMTRSQYRIFRSCLTPDSRNSVSDERLRDMRMLWDELELVICSEKEVPTPSHIVDFPKTWAEAMERKRQAKAERKAKAEQTQRDAD